MGIIFVVFIVGICFICDPMFAQFVQEWLLELATNLRDDFTITEKGPSP